MTIMLAEKLFIAFAATSLGLAASLGSATEPPVGPGDDRRGYDEVDYETRSRRVDSPRPQESVDERGDSAARLGLPPLERDTGQPRLAERIALGRLLFFDRRLSGNGTMSCAMCHVPEHGFAHNEMRVAIGIEGRSGRRNAPTLMNAAYQPRLFYDGREFSLETQVWSPLLAANEMGNASVGMVIETISALSDYDGLFEAAFDRGPSMETVGSALASYQRTLLSGDSPFDRWLYGGEDSAMSPAAQRGFGLFTGKARCSACHVIGRDWALFTDHGYHNTGVGAELAASRKRGTAHIPVAPGERLEVSTQGLRHLGGVAEVDLGRYEVTRNPDDRGRFRTAMLRNVALTAPYMHDGSLATLEEVIRFYDAGGIPNETLDPLMRPLGLTGSEQTELVEFLEALTGGNVAALAARARATPIGN
jgi:cytochrome c peroxidase